MKLSEIKNILPGLEDVIFKTPQGTIVPEHFHVTEVGVITKHFIDCGGTVRNEQVVNFQLWNANDTDHRLKPSKLLNIIKLSEEKLGIGDYPVEVEYQGSETIGKYDIDFNGVHFQLVPKATDCLAKDSCGTSSEKAKKNLSELNAAACCTPGGGCC